MDDLASLSPLDITRFMTNGTKSRYRLQFNVSVPNHEKITSAELHLFFLLDARSRVDSHSFKATVKVYEVYYNDWISTTQLLEGKEVTGSQGMWETFDVTSAFQRWIKSDPGATAFDVLLDGKDCGTTESGKEGAGCSNMSVSVGESTSATLIIFSDDLSSRRSETKKELKEMIVHEEETTLHTDTDWNKAEELSSEILEAQHRSRKKRKAEREYCRRTSLKVNFKEIGWDSWIVAPPEYDAFECRGFCYHPLTDESTPSKHALIQTLINIRNPKKANMACCVPIKLDPITVMYQENGRLTIRYLYEEMKVAECGCR